MSSLALMRWLESAPERYDAGMRLLTLGRITPLREVLAQTAAPTPGAEVLEIGCGTGAVTALLLERGARVTALDQNPEMLEQARHRLATSSVGSADLLERTASEIDGLPERSFDAVVASLSLSEMSPGERSFVLREANIRLKPGGLLVLGDEVRPQGASRRILHALLRAPQALLGWLLAGSISRPIPDLTGEVREAGFRILGEQRWLLGGLAVVMAERKP
ncbi:MAG: corrinoid protein-associated methyltransferase CpaM [Planctomycetota bacterium]|jgi:demethylmenaquinone methyltransferase/2-methoxy-6-polyprenyl-1,4-benzoquinol methylase